MTNWEFFKRDFKRRKARIKFPTILLVNNREDDYDFKNNPTAVGYYNANRNNITLLREHDCLPLRLHEYGHWFNYAVFQYIEIIWEFIWWGLSIRNLFVKGAEENE